MNDVIHLSPLHRLLRMQHEVDRLFDGLHPRKHGNDKADTAVWAPRADLAETEDAYMILLDVPGVNKKDVSINYQEGMLSVSGERQIPDHGEAKATHRERWSGHFYREFGVAKSIQADKIEASYEGGILSIRIPKAETSKPKRISVK